MIVYLGDIRLKDMIAIAFESSGGKASVAISRDGVILAQAEHLARHGHAAWLLTLARDALAEAGLTAADCDIVLGGRGPGSFTGIRVALAAAKGLGLGLGIPARGLSSLEAMAAAVADGANHVAAIADSRRGSVFLALVGPDGEILEPPQDLTPEAAGKRLAATAPGLIITGHVDLVPMIAGMETCQVITAEPEAAQLCQYFSSSGDIDPAAMPLEPLYLAPPLLGPSGP